MKTTSIFKLSVIALSLASVSNVNASINQKISTAVKDSKVEAMFRYRAEIVDQDGLKENALASTLKSRISLTSGAIGNFKANVEIDNVSYIGNDSFNSTINGETDYPVVADPQGTELNQAFVSYQHGTTKATLGRQRIVLDDQRFVGGVAWRQNEQTFDGYRLQSSLTDGLKIDASYIYNVNRIFGEDSKNSDMHGDILLLNAKYAVNKNHQISLYNYRLDFDKNINNSSDTIGISYRGKIDNITVKAAYAAQKEVGDRANFSADYYMIEAMAKFKQFNVGLGYEVLGSDDGKAAFATPLATLHKFQGFSDKFLGTPATGIEDIYIKGSTKIAKVGLSGAYHVYRSEYNSNDYGTELNLAASYKINSNMSGLVKLANYSADEYATDTTKVWLMLTAKY